MALPKTESYTIEDIYGLPEGERAELIDGQIYYMAPPSRQHQEISGVLFRRIADYIDQKKGSCKVYAAPFAVHLDEKTDTYVEPDVSVICDRDKLDDKGCKGAPDWVIEIVSSSTRNMDYTTKLFKYRTAGVKEYWIVDPSKSRVFVYDFEECSMVEYSFKDSVNSNTFDGLSVDFSKIDLS